MTERSIKNYHKLKRLHDGNGKTRKRIIAKADKELIDTVCECFKNILCGRVKTSKEVKSKLKYNQKAWEKIYKKTTRLPRKKQLLIQQGGFLPAIIAPLLGIAASVISGIV